MMLDAVDDLRWSSFNDAMRLVRAKHPQLDSRRIFAWLFKCAVTGAVRVRGNCRLEENLDRFRRGRRGWVETDLLSDLPEATWSGRDIALALREVTPGKDSAPTGTESRPQGKGGRPCGYSWPAIGRIVRDWHPDTAEAPRPVDLAKDIKEAAERIGERPSDKSIERWASRWVREWWPHK